MAEGYVIGVDLGGTKLLAGAIDADLSVIHRTNRLVYGLSQDELVQMVADAMEEIRTAVGGPIEAIGFGIPCTFDSRTGMAVQAVNVPLKDVAFGEVMAERLGVPVVVDNDAKPLQATAGSGSSSTSIRPPVSLSCTTGPFGMKSPDSPVASDR
jgi:glucokinase